MASVYQLMLVGSPERSCVSEIAAIAFSLSDLGWGAALVPYWLLAECCSIYCLMNRWSSSLLKMMTPERMQD